MPHAVGTHSAGLSAECTGIPWGRGVSTFKAAPVEPFNREPADASATESGSWETAGCKMVRVAAGRTFRVGTVWHLQRKLWFPHLGSQATPHAADKRVARTHCVGMKWCRAHCVAAKLSYCHSCWLGMKYGFLLPPCSARLTQLTFPLNHISSYVCLFFLMP